MSLSRLNAAMPMNDFHGFPPASLKFLQRIRRNNNREWFARNRQTYDEAVKAPLQELVATLGGELRRVAPEVIADPARAIYRIHRDVRFSPDKSPYKTHVAAIFPVRGMPKNTGPGLYFHYSAEEVLIGGGVYAPEPAELRAIREHVAAHHRQLTKIVSARAFQRLFKGMEGEQLKNLPKGYLAGHPAERYLRYKQFLFAKQFKPELALSGKLLSELVSCFRAGMPLIRFLAVPMRAAQADNFASRKLNW